MLAAFVHFKMTGSALYKALRELQKLGNSRVTDVFVNDAVIIAEFPKDFLLVCEILHEEAKPSASAQHAEAFKVLLQRSGLHG